MSTENLDRLAALILAGRSRRRRVYALLDGWEFWLMREMAQRNTLSIRLHGVTFRAVPARVLGSPSMRKKWRAAMPEVCVPAWLKLRELDVTYPTRSNA